MDKKPGFEELRTFRDNRKQAAAYFDVSERTIIRWLQYHNLYAPREGHGRKLDLDKAREIRKKHSDGKTIKQLAREYNVTFSSISRIVQNINYKEVRDTALVGVIYNL